MRLRAATVIVALCAIVLCPIMVLAVDTASTTSSVSSISWEPKEPPQEYVCHVTGRSCERDTDCYSPLPSCVNCYCNVSIETCACP